MLETVEADFNSATGGMSACPACSKAWASRCSLLVDIRSDQEEMRIGHLKGLPMALRYGRCRSCSSLIAIDERRNPEHLAAIYRELPESYWSQLSPQDRFGLIVEKLLSSKMSGGDVWDVGCGTGTLLNALSGKWKKHGIEPGRTAVALARAKGLHVIEGTAPELAFDAVADAVILVDVIEHLTAPASELAALYRMLRPGGHLLIFTGDANSFTARIAAEKWYYLQCVGHVTVLSAGAVRGLLDRAGFERITTRNVNHQGAKSLYRWSRRILGNSLRKLIRQPWAPVPYYGDHKLYLASKPR